MLIFIINKKIKSKKFILSNFILDKYNTKKNNL